MVATLHWFRSDLRLHDNTALLAAARSSDSLALAFVFDEKLLASPMQGAPRIRFLRDCVARLDADLRERGRSLIVRRGDPRREIPKLARSLGVRRVVWNRDVSPYAAARDAAVEAALARDGVAIETAKDRVVFESGEVLSQQNRPFAVYSPYRKAWWRRYDEGPPDDPAPLRLPPGPDEAPALPDEKALGVDADPTRIPTGGERAARRRLATFLADAAARYHEDRDAPAKDGTSRLAPYLRFGVVSIRQCFREGRAAAADPAFAKGTQKWLDELVWREFYHAILSEQPHVMRGAYRREYDALEWENDPALFEAWQQGRTGYPFVDAGMRELLETGYMHNRVRMVVASFLTKDLLVDWRWGERHFMQHLVDGDPANNNGGWQWAASTGTDAQPYFRIFNPVSQSERFDPDGDYIRRFVPELRGVRGKLVHRPWESPIEAPEYPPPIVDHAERRQRALQIFEAVRSAAGA